MAKEASVYKFSENVRELTEEEEVEFWGGQEFYEKYLAVRDMLPDWFWPCD